MRKVKKKLTMVSVNYRGRPKVVFVYAPVDEQGHTYISMALLDKLAGELGAQHGETFSHG